MADTTSNPSASKPLSFEEAIDRLETMIDDIESGEVGLEEAIERYAQGQSLVTRCRAILDKAEQRIAELTPDAGHPAPDGSADTDEDE